MQIQNYREHLIGFSVLVPPHTKDHKATDALKAAMIEFKQKIESNGLGMIILPNLSNQAAKEAAKEKEKKESNTQSTIESDSENETNTNMITPNNNILKTFEQYGDVDISKIIENFSDYSDSIQHKKKRARKQQSFCTGKKEQKLKTNKEGVLGEGLNLIPKAITLSNL